MGLQNNGSHMYFVLYHKLHLLQCDLSRNIVILNVYKELYYRVY